jgi:LPXTG-site transpeptidase (sortase) family protein
MRWVDQAFSTEMGEQRAKPVPAISSDNFPGPAHRGSMPSVPFPPLGSLIGRLDIPRVGISVMVLEGDGDEILGKAAGHVPATALPGGAGNVVIAGHRDTFFRPLRKIRNDDAIIFTTTQGIYHYKVGSIKKVGPQDVQVLQASDHPELTLITCYPFDYLGPAPMRFVVQAAEIPSSPVEERDQSLARARPTPNTHVEATKICKAL